MARYLLLPTALLQNDGSMPYARANALAGAVNALLATRETIELRYREQAHRVHEHNRKGAQKFLDECAEEHPMLVNLKDDGEWTATILEHKLLPDGSLCIREDGQWHRALPDGSRQSVAFECPW